MKALAVIPARGGSQRIPGKNMVDVAGKPMLRWTIDAAREAECIDTVVASTDDLDIGDYAWKSGAMVHYRGKDLSADDVPAWMVVVEVWRAGNLHDDVDALVMLLPTAPCRTAQDIDEAFGYWRDRDPHSSLVSVTELHTNALVALSAQDWIVPHLPISTWYGEGEIRLPDTYFSNGAIQITSVESVVKRDDRERNPFRLPKTIPWELPWDRGIDVDTPDQLAVVRALLETRQERAA